MRVRSTRSIKTKGLERVPYVSLGVLRPYVTLKMEEKARTRVLPNLERVTVGGDLYSYRYVGGGGVTHNIVVDLRDGYASCLPCQSFIVRGVCSHLLAAFLQLAKDGDIGAVVCAVQTVAAKCSTKGSWGEVSHSNVY